MKTDVFFSIQLLNFHNDISGVARPVLVVPWIVIQELDSLKVHKHMFVGIPMVPQSRKRSMIECR